MNEYTGIREIKGIGEVLLDNLSEKFYVGSPSAS